MKLQKLETSIGMILFYSHSASNHWAVQTVLHLPHYLWKQGKGGSAASNLYLLWSWLQYFVDPQVCQWFQVSGLDIASGSIPNMNHCW